MFRVGLDVNGDLLRHRLHAAVAISHASVVAPFGLGSILALWLYPRFSTGDVSFDSFALFMGLAMSVTAFPVLARILTDRGLARSEIGTVALACAAVDDVTAWCLLALVVGITQSRAGDAAPIAVLTVLFLATMWVVIRRVIARLASWLDARAGTEDGLAIALAGVLLAALLTELIGIHAIFGAFIFGIVIPRDSRLAHSLARELSGVVTIVLLPTYFAYTGMRTQIALVSGWSDWAACAFIILIATVGKLGGTVVSGRFGGMAWQPAVSLGILMNTRGLMELVVLNIGLDLGVLSPKLYTMMVLMALVTTMATTPALRLLDLATTRQRVGPTLDPVRDATPVSR
jgi:Kef-type K+ transport system membrane component KefB